MILKEGKNYRWVFFIFLAIWMLLIFVGQKAIFTLAPWILFGFMASLIIVQLVSGLALTSKWEAKIKRGTKEYYLIMGFQVLVLAVMGLVGLSQYRV